jgi:HAD superfamily hydrolase (TIGR01509 family)
VRLPEGWSPYADTEATLRGLRAAGVPVAVVSNIGFDIRPLFKAWDLLDLVDAFVLSYEVGHCKPDLAIFSRACAELGVAPERAVMVGDTPADAAAVRAGLSALVLPAAGPGEVNGLAGVLALALSAPPSLSG